MTGVSDYGRYKQRADHDLDKVLSVVMEHEEIQQIAEAVRKALKKRAPRVIDEEAEHDRD